MTPIRSLFLLSSLFLAACSQSEKAEHSSSSASNSHIGVGAEPIDGAAVLLDGTRASLDANWEYWEGPRFNSKMPIKWLDAEDPVDGGPAISANDAAAAGGKYGAADITTKNKYGDKRVHVEFLITTEGGNSGVYLQNRYEIQILDGDKTNVQINKVWGGPNSGLDGGNDNGFGITDRPGGLKLQAEGHDVRYRKVWIKEMNFEDADTDF
jgi:hypothetical protein